MRNDAGLMKAADVAGWVDVADGAVESCLAKGDRVLVAGHSLSGELLVGLHGLLTLMRQDGSIEAAEFAARNLWLCEFLVDLGFRMIFRMICRCSCFCL